MNEESGITDEGADDQEIGRVNCQSATPCYAYLVVAVKSLLEVVEAPSIKCGGHIDVIRAERKQYFDAKKKITNMIFKA